MSRNIHRNQAMERNQLSTCNCASDPGAAKPAQPERQLHMGDLVPIAVVIAAGCEPCAEKMVRRALEQGAPPESIVHVLRIVASMQKLECFAQAMGTEATARMEKPLAAAERTLHQVLAVLVDQT